jgi:hypothetical protein
MNHEEQRLFEQQQRVFGALDIATKPIQFAADMFVGALLFLAGALALICLPFYLLFTGGFAAVTSVSALWSLLALFTVILLFLSPAYAGFGLLGSVASWACWGLYVHNHMNHEPYFMSAADEQSYHQFMPKVMTYAQWCNHTGEPGLRELAWVLTFFLCLGYFLYFVRRVKEQKRKRQLG